MVAALASDSTPTHSLGSPDSRARNTPTGKEQKISARGSTQGDVNNLLDKELGLAGHLMGAKAEMTKMTSVIDAMNQGYTDAIFTDIPKTLRVTYSPDPGSVYLARLCIYDCDGTGSVAQTSEQVIEDYGQAEVAFKKPPVEDGSFQMIIRFLNRQRFLRPGGFGSVSWPPGVVTFVWEKDGSNHSVPSSPKMRLFPECNLIYDRELSKGQILLVKATVAGTGAIEVPVTVLGEADISGFRCIAFEENYQEETRSGSLPPVIRKVTHRIYLDVDRKIPIRSDRTETEVFAPEHFAASKDDRARIFKLSVPKGNTKVRKTLFQIMGPKQQK